MIQRPGDRAGTPARAGVFALAASLFVAAAWAQTIRIPDFRQPPPAPTTVRAGEPCENCGRILSIREIQVQRKPNVPQAFQATSAGTSGPGERNLVGAVIYLPLGGNETADKPFVGGVGTPEMRERFQETTYEIAVRLDDGALRVVERHDGSRYRVGDKVRLPGAGQIELIVD